MVDKERGWAWHIVTLVVFTVVMVAMYAGVYQQLTIKWDSEWMYALAFFGAPIALGAAWRSLWALVLPITAAAVSLPFLGAGDALTTFLLIIYGVPIGVLLVGFGHVLAYGIGRAGWEGAVTAFPIALFAVAAIPLAESLRRATFHRMPAAELSALGLADSSDLSLVCEDADPRRADIDRVRRLIVATEQHPDWVVTFEDVGSDETTTERRTLRQYARDVLKDAPRSCRPDLRAQLQAAVR